ncbi:MAG TPA: hypothetical protein P5560_00450 [Thermotogota bacterium]|nr:hypothetical protein [Thermotogota bacterium]HRW91402.1 hypothetical protein [Thermotogota bacterium]
MKMLSIQRLFGILIALGVFVAGVVLLDLLPFLKFQEESNALREAAQIYETTYRTLELEKTKYAQYSALEQKSAEEFDGLQAIFRQAGAPLEPHGDSFVFSGWVDGNTLARVLNFLGGCSTLVLESFSFESQSPLPIMIGKAESFPVRVDLFQVKRVPYDVSLVKR